MHLRIQRDSDGSRSALDGAVHPCGSFHSRSCFVRCLRWRSRPDGRLGIALRKRIRFARRYRLVRNRSGADDVFSPFKTSGKLSASPLARLVHRFHLSPLRSDPARPFQRPHSSGSLFSKKKTRKQRFHRTSRSRRSRIDHQPRFFSQPLRSSSRIHHSSDSDAPRRLADGERNPISRLQTCQLARTRPFPKFYPRSDYRRSSLAFLGSRARDPFLRLHFYRNFSSYPKNEPPRTPDERAENSTCGTCEEEPKNG